MRSPGSASSLRSCLLSSSGRTRARFLTAGHLVSWAKFAPGVKESAGRRRGSGSTGHGNPYLARVLGEAAGFYDTRIGPERAKHNHIRQLQALGYKVTLDPAT
jgi:transposase